MFARNPFICPFFFISFSYSLSSFLSRFPLRFIRFIFLLLSPPPHPPHPRYPISSSTTTSSALPFFLSNSLDPETARRFYWSAYSRSIKDLSVLSTQSLSSTSQNFLIEFVRRYIALHLLLFLFHLPLNSLLLLPFPPSPHKRMHISFYLTFAPPRSLTLSQVDWCWSPRMSCAVVGIVVSVASFHRDPR